MALTEVRHGPRGGKKANHSPLMKALETAQEGEIVNACPFGCEDADLDSQRNCCHVVGVTLPAAPGVTPTHYELLEPLDEKTGRRKINGKKIEKVRPGDKMMRLTSSHYVYRPDKAEK